MTPKRADKDSDCGVCAKSTMSTVTKVGQIHLSSVTRRTHQQILYPSFYTLAPNDRGLVMAT